MFDDDVELVEKNYLKKLEEIAEKSKWVSVKDRLPEEGSNVLIYYEDTYFDRKCIDVDRVDESGNFSYYDNGKVTHWMPLPEPPKEE